LGNISSEYPLSGQHAVLYLGGVSVFRRCLAKRNLTLLNYIKALTQGNSAWFFSSSAVRLWSTFCMPSASVCHACNKKHCLL